MERLDVLHAHAGVVLHDPVHRLRQGRPDRRAGGSFRTDLRRYRVGGSRRRRAERADDLGDRLGVHSSGRPKQAADPLQVLIVEPERLQLELAEPRDPAAMLHDGNLVIVEHRDGAPVGVEERPDPPPRAQLRDLGQWRGACVRGHEVGGARRNPLGTSLHLDLSARQDAISACPRRIVGWQRQLQRPARSAGLTGSAPEGHAVAGQAQVGRVPVGCPQVL